MSQLDPWEKISEMAHEARSTNSGHVFAAVVPGEPPLRLWRQGPITRFYLGEQEVIAPVFAVALSGQRQMLKELIAKVRQEKGAGPDTNDTDPADLPAMPRDYFDEYGVQIDAAAGLTKREYAEVHVLAGALCSISDAHEAVDYAKLAVSILVGEWAERETENGNHGH